MSTGTTDLQPVEIRHESDHAFVKEGRFGEKRCAVCGHGKKHPSHRGTPPSMNDLVAGAGRGSRFAFVNAKENWMRTLGVLLEGSELQPCGRIVVEGVMCFPNRIRRDQGNYRTFIEKALGDVLTQMGYLQDDDWTRYEFGGLGYRYAPGESWTRLVLFPSAEPVSFDAQQALAIT